ncbi:hypothetical protein N7540_006117 [Penicillium herquei]|nr:hypothetical protein N7540_006117 [Penicillium herquei]
MMKYFGSVLLLSTVALAHPTGLWWGTDFCYPSPENTDNHCSPSQEAGFDWSQLANGDNWSYEGFSFNGFAPKNGCRASGGKCIEGRLSQEDDWALQIDANQAPFSVRKFHITTSRDVDLIMTYTLANGKTCHQVASTTPEGSDVVNEQCGGAVSVSFQLAVFNQVGDVDLELHQVGFDCSTGPKPAGPLVETHSQSYLPPTPASHTISIVYTKPPQAHTTHPEAHTSPSKPVEMTTSTKWITEEITVTKCHPTVTDCPAHSTVISSHITSQTTSWPVTDAVTVPTAPASHSISQPASTPPAQPSSPSKPECPDLVPKCLNTWLSVPNCSSNSDVACFCPSSEFTSKYKSCVNAWSTSKEQEDSALSYFAGICAPYIPKNPDIISLVPSSTATAPTHVPTAVVPAPTEPATPLKSEPTPPCTTITWSSHTVTVPQVQFSTSTGASTTVVNLVPGPTSHSSVPTTTPMSHTTCKSSFTTVPAKTTSTTCTTSASSTTITSVPTSTPTFISSNSASKMFSGSVWAVGVALFILSLQ